MNWELDRISEHVGIVEKEENWKVYIIEGNSTIDGCRQNEYALNNNVI